MISTLTKTLAGLLLTCSILGPFPSAQAMESPESLSVTIDNIAQFPTSDGEEVLLPAGVYSVKVSNEDFTLTGKDTTTFTIETMQSTHTEQVTLPGMVYISSGEAEPTPRHLLALYYPDGRTLQALGTDPTITSRASMEPSVEDLEYIDPTLVTFEQAVHFIGPDGIPVVIPPGTYSAEAGQSAIRLLSVDQSQAALNIGAQEGTHETEIKDFLALAIPGTTPQELDLYHVMLLLPDGTSLEATGSYSGIHTRNWFKKTFNKAKKTVNRTYKKVKKTPAFKKVNQVAKQAGNTAKQGTKIVGSGIKQGVSATKWAAGKAAKGVVIGANETWKGMKWAGKQIGAGAKIAACFTTVGALQAGKAVATFIQQVIPVGRKKQGDTQNRVNKDPNFRDSLIQKMTNGIAANTFAIPELRRISNYMNNSKNRSKLDSIFNPKSFCGDSVATMDKKLNQLGLVPDFAKIRSRGTDDPRFFMGYQVTVDVAKVGGMQLGLFGVTDFKGGGGKYIFVGPELGAVVGGGFTAEAIFFPKVPLESFTGWGAGVGGTLGKVITGAVDVIFDEKFVFQGFGVGGGAGAGSKMIGSLAVSYTHAWKY